MVHLRSPIVTLWYGGGWDLLVAHLATNTHNLTRASFERPPSVPCAVGIDRSPFGVLQGKMRRWYVTPEGSPPPHPPTYTVERG